MWPYPIDWATTGVWMQAWSGFAAAIAVVWAAKFGVSAFLTQRQIERKVAAAERIMTFVYKAKRGIAAIRNAGSFSYENDAAEKALREADPNFTNLDKGKRSRMITGQVIYSRVNDAKEVWAELFECLPVARAFFGKECENKIHALWEVRAQIRTSAHMYGTVDPNRNQPNSEKYEADMWEAADDGGVGGVNAKLVAVIEYMETNVLPLIGGVLPKPNDSAIRTALGG